MSNFIDMHITSNIIKSILLDSEDDFSMETVRNRGELYWSITDTVGREKEKIMAVKVTF
jgi:hypothetical protein